ncbi:MAG TPA: DsbA family protein [Acidimicrobiia bacterium]|nr:DsbA family protein [Acidimicrobiia bacterium]
MVNDMSSDTSPGRIGFHFDVMCPWAYQGAVWIRDVRDQTGLEIDWRFFSLEEINHVDGKKHPWERRWSYGWGMLRVAALLRRTSMDDCDRFYEAAGRALHVDGRKPHRPEVAAELLAELGLDPGLVDAAIADETTHADVKADHDEVVGHGGFGVPTLVFEDGSHLYGPVITPAPTGDDALALWDLVSATRRFPHLYELKRPKTSADLGHIADQFAPYLSARDWETRVKPAL